MPKKQYLITWKTGLERFNKLLQAYPISEQSNRDVFVTVGYTSLTPGDKETYFVLKDLALLNEKTKQEYSCQVSLDYLAELLGTTSFCQLRRIKKLKESGLITVQQRSSNSNSSNKYVPIRWAFPDSTLVTKLVKLIRRKRILTLIHNYDNTSLTQEEKDKVINEVRTLIKKMPHLDKHLSKEIKQYL